jgi:hypothetical protein
MNSLLLLCRSLASASALLWLSACSTYDVTLDAIARGKLPEIDVASVSANAQGDSARAVIATTTGSSYWIHSSNPAIAADDLRFKEAAGHIRTALSGHGLWLAENAATADMMVEFEYGIAPPRAIDTRRVEPVYGPAPDDQPGLGPLVQNTNHRTQLNATNDGNDEFVGYLDTTTSTLVYEKHLAVTCRENKRRADGKPPFELWTISASIEDESRNLREYLPVLAAAVMVKIGQTTNGAVVDRLKTDDDAIRFVKAGM